MDGFYYKMKSRFRGFLPVVIDVETGGTNPEQNPILEVAAVFLELDKYGSLTPGAEFCDHISPFEGSVIENEALEINQIDPDYPLRFPRPEKEVLQDLFARIGTEVKRQQCRRAVLVGHNAHFDLAFINSGCRRAKLESSNPLHAFSVFDTVTLGALAYGQTILSIVCQKAEIEFDSEYAHSAIYDAQKTAEVFCKIHNRWLHLGGSELVPGKLGVSSKMPVTENKRPAKIS